MNVNGKFFVCFCLPSLFQQNDVSITGFRSVFARFHFDLDGACFTWHQLQLFLRIRNDLYPVWIIKGKVVVDVDIVFCRVIRTTVCYLKILDDDLFARMQGVISIRICFGGFLLGFRGLLWWYDSYCLWWIIRRLSLFCRRVLIL